MNSDQRWRFLRTTFFILFFFLHQNLMFGLCFSTEALALMKFKERIERDPFGALMNWREIPHCSWSGVVCSHGRVVILNLQDLSLQGTLAPELGNLTHLKSLILRNNSFSGKVPEEVTKLQELKILDLFDNNFEEESFLFSRRLLQLPPPGGFDVASPPPPPPLFRSPAPPPFRAIDPFQDIPPPPRDATSPAGDPSDTSNLPPAKPPPVSAPSPQSPSLDQPTVQTSDTMNNKKKKSPIFIIVGVVVGVLAVMAAASVAFFLLRNQKVTMINQWATGSNGQLKSIVITGVPKLKLSELETACEDFSNIIGTTSSNATIYKGTLSTGSEIAVLAIASGSLQNWSEDLETRFQEKIEKLSQVDHKNFLNVIGYCHEDEPFNRMMVFEYAPNGSLSEHLHEEDAEHLDWPKRLRIIMGIAYCVEHMDNLNFKPISYTNLNSSSIYLSTDYAAKLADFTFLSFTSPDLITNVFSFGNILHEIVTGKILNQDSSLLQETKPVPDPTLKSFEEDVMEKLWGVVKECLNQNQRLEMKEVVAKLREITGINAEAALPRLNPAWWAELAIITSEGN